VIINDSQKFHPIRFHLIALISCIFFLSGTFVAGHAQANKNDILLEFVKSSDSLLTTDLYFNVLKIINNSPKATTGTVSFNGPEHWNFFAIPNFQTTIEPNDTAWIPLRVSPNADAIGGITYVVSASFKTRERQYGANTYLTLPTKVKWEFSTNKSSIYFTEHSSYATFQINLSNKGNKNELIKLDLKLGKLLVFMNNKNNDFIQYVDLPAFKDTVISYVVTYQKDLSYNEKLRYENNWKESSIHATASTEKTEKSASIMIRKLNSTYVNQRIQNSTPLNIDYQVYNLMSNQQPRSNIRVFGSILLPKNREIEYLAGIQNFYYTSAGNQNFDIDRQLLYSLRYRDNRNRIEVGYNVNGGNLHSINGRGIVGLYKVNNKTRISYAFTQNPFSQNIGQHIGISTSLKNIAFNTEATHESNALSNYSASSLLAGSGFTLFKHHGVSFQLMGSQSNYKLGEGRDTSVLGMSYKINYNVRYKKFEMRVSTLNSMKNYIRNSGLQNIYLDSKYTLNETVRFSLYGSRQHYSTTRYPYNFFNPINFNTTDYLRLITSVSGGNIIYQLGPNYNGSVRQFHNLLTGYRSEYRTYQPGIWAAATYKLPGYRSVTPNITVSNLRFYYNTNDPVLENYSLEKNIYYSFGLNYFDTNWRLNAYYTSGSTSDLYRSVQIDEQPVQSKSLQFRPSYENYFFNRTVKLSAYLNYAYYMPSGRENISYNIKYDQFIKGGWVFSVSGYMYSNNRVTPDLGRINTKDLNFVVGITKSFNIQQPRLKYYDFKTVFYNDLDGNRMKSENEPPISNILVKIEKDRAVSQVNSSIPEVELISDDNGQINFENLPRDNYNLVFNPIVNLESLYFIDGATQPYLNDKKRVLYVPLAESYKIKGRIIIKRDPNSTEGKIDLSGIRVTATGMRGENYSALSDNFGSYLLNVPTAEKFKVKVVNVFGEHFSIENDEMDIQFIQNKTISLDFVFEEKKRTIEFENGTELFNFSSLSADAEAVEIDNAPKEVVALDSKSPKTKNAEKASNETSKQKVDATQVPIIEKTEKVGLEKGTVTLQETAAEKLISENPVSSVPLIGKGIPETNTVDASPSQILSAESNALRKKYAIQIDMLKSFREPDYFKNKYNLDEEVLYVEQDGNFKYYIGSFESIDDARAKITKLGISEFFAVDVEPAQLKKTADINAQNASQLKIANTTNSHIAESINVPATKTNNDLLAKTTADNLIQSAVDKNEPALDTESVSENGLSMVKILPVSKTKRFEQLPEGQYYSIQLDVLKIYRFPTHYNAKYNIKDTVKCVEENGVYKYFVGKYSSMDAARGDVAKYGMSGYIILVDASNARKIEKINNQD
jgi:hypothetical protein